MDTVGYISSLESFGLADGPGVRYVIFMQGCNMRCRYCHNPETWHLDGGSKYTVKELLDRALRCRSYWRNNGGITVSGGEPLLQAEFVTELFLKAKNNNIHTALDTSAQPFCSDVDFLSKFDCLLKYTDLVLLDIKAMDDSLHKQLTGYSNENILGAARYLSQRGIPVWIRHVLVPGLTDSEAELLKLKDFIKTLKTVEKTEILPYHTLGVAKWKTLNLKYTLNGVNPPSDEEVKKAEKILLS